MRDRSRIHPPAVAHPVAYPSDLGLRSRHLGLKGPGSKRQTRSKQRARCCGGTSGRATHPSGDTRPRRRWGNTRLREGLAGRWGRHC